MGHNGPLLQQLAGAVCIGLCAGFAARAVRQPVVRADLFLGGGAAVRLPVGVRPAGGAPAGPQGPAAGAGAGHAVPVRLCAGDAQPCGGAVLVQRGGELPAVFCRGGAQRRGHLRAGAACLRHPPGPGRPDGRRGAGRAVHRRRPPGGGGAEPAGAAAGGGAVRDAAQFPASAGPGRGGGRAGHQPDRPRHPGAGGRLFRRGLCGGRCEKLPAGAVRMGALAGRAAALPAGAAGAAAGPPGPQPRPVRPGVPPPLGRPGRDLCADVGDDLSALLLDGRHRGRAAHQCGLDGLCAGSGRERVPGAGLGPAGPGPFGPGSGTRPGPPGPPAARGGGGAAGLYGLHRQPHGQGRAGQPLCHQPGSLLRAGLRPGPGFCRRAG